MANRVNIGCGRTPSEGWINFDNSPAIKLANSPLKYHFAKFFKLVNARQIENIEWNRKNEIGFVDATKPIPLADSSVECIYTSHMLEHLSRDGASAFLEEALRLLEVDGVLRVAVPDLRLAADEYIATEDANFFMEGMRVQAPPFGTLREKLQLLVSGYRHHQWMYDGKSLSALMKAAGFQDVCVYNKGETQLKNPQGLNLYERSSQSVYVEGKK